MKQGSDSKGAGARFPVRRLCTVGSLRRHSKEFHHGKEVDEKTGRIIG